MVFLELLLGTILSVVLVAAGEPDLESDAVVLLEIVDDSESGDDVVELIVSTHQPDYETLPEIVQFLFCEGKIRLKVSSFDVLGILPGWRDSVLEDEEGVDLLWFVSDGCGLEVAGVLWVENCAEVSIGGVLPKLYEFVEVGKLDYLLHVDGVVLVAHLSFVCFLVSIVDDPFVTKGEALEFLLPLHLLFGWH